MIFFILSKRTSSCKHKKISEMICGVLSEKYKNSLKETQLHDYRNDTSLILF